MDAFNLLVIIRQLCKEVKNMPRKQKHLKNKIKKLYSLYILLRQQTKLKTVKCRKFATRAIFTEDMRQLLGVSNTLVKEMEESDKDKFFNYMRMTPNLFYHLLNILTPSIKKQYWIRKPIKPKLRLAITLRYLASGDSMVSLSYSFRVGVNTVSNIISETCDAIWNCLKEQELAVPTKDKWITIADEFERKWNFPHCIGAIDGKHIMIEAPPNSGSEYYNYKNSHSINLLVVADANLRFVLVDIGAVGRQSDGGVFRASNIGQALEMKTLNVPNPSPLQDDPTNVMPYVLVGDEAFALSGYMMRPYPRSGSLNLRKKVFNYRLSRARRVVESAFGILRGRWRIFSKSINASLSTTNKVIQAAVCLHNFIMTYESASSSSHFNIVDHAAQASSGVINMPRTGSNTYSRNAANVRDRFAEYFEHTGAVPWQWEKALRNAF